VIVPANKYQHFGIRSVGLFGQTWECSRRLANYVGKQESREPAIANSRAWGDCRPTVLELLGHRSERHGDLVHLDNEHC
jgi:hypothetical protein